MIARPPGSLDSSGSPERMSASVRTLPRAEGLASSRESKHLLRHRSGSILCNHVQHRLNIRRRAGDDAQDFARRGLLLQRLFEFLEQPNVLDGNYGLVGEGLEKLDLCWGEGVYLGATWEQSSNDFSMLTEGCT